MRRLEQGPLKPQGELGKAFAYSGEGFFYLQRVVEKLTGRSFARHMEQDVLKPLGMTRSGYGWLPAYEGRMATGYDERGNYQVNLVEVSLGSMREASTQVKYVDQRIA
mgnify:CR=1 FL=1